MVSGLPAVLLAIHVSSATSVTHLCTTSACDVIAALIPLNEFPGDSNTDLNCLHAEKTAASSTCLCVVQFATSQAAYTVGGVCSTALVLYCPYLCAMKAAFLKVVTLLTSICSTKWTHLHEGQRLQPFSFASSKASPSSTLSCNQKHAQDC